MPGIEKQENELLFPERRTVVLTTQGKENSFFLGIILRVKFEPNLKFVTVIIYLPSQREMSSGINEIPVMCTTTERKAIKDDILACKWSSCSEWCLSKGGGACTHLYVRQVTITPPALRFLLLVLCL